MDGNPSGVKKLDFGAERRRAAASDVSVRTTPLTCGCQASVAINIRMYRTRDYRMILKSDVRTWIFQAYDVIDM